MQFSTYCKLNIVKVSNISDCRSIFLYPFECDALDMFMNLLHQFNNSALGK